MVNGLDYAIMGCIVSSAVFGALRGFVREALSLVTWACAITVGVLYAETLAQELRFIGIPGVRLLVAFGAILFAVLLLGGILQYILGRLIAWSGLRLTDRVGGLLFGLIRGSLVIASLFLVIEYPMFQHFKSTPLWQGSKLIPPFERWSHFLQEKLPDDILRRIKF